ncbi:MAG: DNA repair protein RecN [Peptococcaceae bacterium]|jgi:DNA repair protein RecN (Recombination protein N)|nr:DNA repair protein RecN [Peptococcaceae bacterium]
MLTELSIENFALMEKVRLRLGAGLSVFTGETGAGKSMLIDALGVLLGGRASVDMIRFGEEKVGIEGIFTGIAADAAQRLEEAGYPAEEGQWILFRELNLNGKNTCRLQGRAVPLSLYRSLCEGLADIHGQLEHQSLLHPAVHRQLLDALGGGEQLELAAEVQKAARAYRELIKKERQLLVLEQEREQRLETLQYQLAEIDEVQPQVGEEEKLQQEKKRMANAEKISHLSATAYKELYEGEEGGRERPALDALGIARKELAELARLDAQSAVLLEQAETAYFAVEELAAAMKAYGEQLAFEPERLTQIEDRLHQLRRLRKYGASLEEITAARETMALEADGIRNLEGQLKELTQEKEKLQRQYEAAADRLSQGREALAQVFQEEIKGELAVLGLEKSRLTVRLEQQNAPSEQGNETVEFYFTANPGEPLKPLAKVASGGEMSRLILALKSLLAQVESVGAFVFDEVDSGIGGGTIRKIGDKLARIAANRQVLCITHAAHVAAYADDHFGIIKESDGERTRTVLIRLEGEARVRELARMLGGDQGGIAYQHAEELLKEARL